MDEQSRYQIQALDTKTILDLCCCSIHEYKSYESQLEWFIHIKCHIVHVLLPIASCSSQSLPGGIADGPLVKHFS